jgi:beta-mannosidase
VSRITLPIPNESHSMRLDLDTDWWIIQDVHDTGERLGLPAGEPVMTDVGHQLSEWEPLDRLEHLQVVLDAQPYWGRHLRYFNAAPWWYRREIHVPAEAGERAVLRFTNVDYFCRVWLNGVLLGEHEGYSIPFEFDVTDALRPGETNTLLVKVWSPWDSRVHDDRYDRRTFQVERDLVKGTYEHDDTLVARDVNPIGIYGSVSLEVQDGPAFEGRPRISYDLDRAARSARVTVRGRATPSQGTVTVVISDDGTGIVVASESATIQHGEFSAELTVDAVRLWTTWDHGDQPLYSVELALDGGERLSRRIGFREVTLERDDEQSTYRLNGDRFYVRGTSYFPDTYISTMTRERYLRDLLAIRSAGFNLVRVHVHVELPEFYDLCDELGIALMQDSEYNWTHPLDSAWADRLISIYEQTILLLEDHPSMITWICLNEPNVAEHNERQQSSAMEISPGPQLYAAVTALDPSRPVIKGSFCFDDLTSGDSHNYTGSLQGPDTLYTDIDGSTEKLNTEFGFDAPGVIENLRREPAMFARLLPLIPRLGDVQEYQYRLLKYYLEHYRSQRGKPNSGYVQFMFIDLSPQSFYGVQDWWGVPKRSMAALLESNQPVAVLLEQTAASVTGLAVINDTHRDLGEVTVSWTVTDSDGGVLSQGAKTACVGADCLVTVTELSIGARPGVSARLEVCSADGTVLSRNRYDALFDHPAHTSGHPNRMSHELGMRVYDA